MTNGFYKYEDNTILLYAPNFVVNKNYNLYKEQKDQYTYPVDGWYWFETEELAKEFFNIVDEEPTT